MLTGPAALAQASQAESGNGMHQKQDRLTPQRASTGAGAVAGYAEQECLGELDSHLLELDRQLHAHWGLGRNQLLAWCPHEAGILLLVAPHYAIAEYIAANTAEEPAGDAQDVIARLLSGSRLFSVRQLHDAARLLNLEPQVLALRKPLTGNAAETTYVNGLVKRYGVSHVARRAAALFDIVGFGLLRPFEQMTQLNSLAYSLNSAHSRMLDGRMSVDFARSSTGDGFYIWNRSVGLEADVSLYHFMHFVLADNAIARRQARARTVPLLRACFHVGGCYEFHHAEGLNPTLYTQIVGDVTIELARMIERAMPGQILLGAFDSTAPDAIPPEQPKPDAIDFVEQAQGNLSRLRGLELSGEAIESIKCYLTGQMQADGSYSIRKLAVSDKHGRSHAVFNAKVNIYRRAAPPILLGIEDRQLRGHDVPTVTTGHILRRGTTVR